MKRWFLRTAILCSVLLFSMTTVVAGAKTTVAHPVDYMKGVAKYLVADLTKHQKNLSHKVVARIIYERIIPHFDLGTMARSVMGRRYWRLATPAQRSQFQREFTDMIVNTYAAAVEQYDGDKIKFHPMRADYGKYRLISVSSVVIRPNGNRISVRYKLRRFGNRWKVYDFSIESISMVSSYRSQFSGVLHSKGVAGLIKRLKAHNRKVNES